MAFKINLSSKDGKTYKLEAEAPGLVNKRSLGDTIKGEEISPDLAGYELEITGLSDKSGFTSLKDVQGFVLKKELLGYGKAMHKRPKGDKKKAPTSAGGLRLRKTVRGKVISEAISQINTKVLKEGGKKLSEVFPDQNKAPEAQAPTESPDNNNATGEAGENAAPEGGAPKTETPAQEQAEKPKEEAAPQEAQPEKEPAESEASKEEKANPEEEPKA